MLTSQNAQGVGIVNGIAPPEQSGLTLQSKAAMFRRAAKACPAGVNVQGYIALAGEGRYEDAYRLIKQRNPFPSICGGEYVRILPVRMQQKRP